VSENFISKIQHLASEKPDLGEIQRQKLSNNISSVENLQLPAHPRPPNVLTHGAAEQKKNKKLNTLK